MGLSALLKNSLQDSMGDDQGPWRQFICDHLDYIALRSQIYSIDPSVMYAYQYNLGQYLVDKVQRQLDIGWIVQLLNDYPNDFSFVDQSSIIIPRDDLITSLYGSFNTISSNATQS